MTANSHLISVHPPIIAKYRPGDVPGWVFTGGGKPEMFRPTPEKWRGANIELVLKLAESLYPEMNLAIAWTAGCFVLIDLNQAQEVKHA